MSHATPSIPKLSKSTISAVQRVLTGNEIDGLARTPYRSGPKIIEFFNELGFDDSYSWGGSGSRWYLAESRLDTLNGTVQVLKAIESTLDPVNFLGTSFDCEFAANYLAKYLEHDGFALRLVRNKWRVVRRDGAAVEVEAALNPQQFASHEYIAEQLDKCDRKIVDQDYDGAITNARSAVEAVLTDIERRLDAGAPDPDGDLPRLYKRVQKLLNLDPERAELSEPLKQILRGLTGIVSGLAPMRNRMSDAHVRTYKPSRHHAKLAVNAAKTLLDFVYDTFEYQKQRGSIKELQPDVTPQ